MPLAVEVFLGCAHEAGQDDPALLRPSGCDYLCQSRQELAGRRQAELPFGKPEPARDLDRVEPAVGDCCRDLVLTPVQESGNRLEGANPRESQSDFQASGLACCVRSEVFDRDAVKVGWHEEASARLAKPRCGGCCRLAHQGRPAHGISGCTIRSKGCLGHYDVGSGATALLPIVVNPLVVLPNRYPSMEKRISMSCLTSCFMWCRAVNSFFVAGERFMSPGVVQTHQFSRCGMRSRLSPSGCPL